VDVAVKAYPMVVTTVGDMRPNVRKYIRNLYNSRSASEFFTRQNLHESKAADDVIELKRLAECDPLTITDEQWTPIYNQISSLPDFRCQGIALGQAWASYLSGDTVASHTLYDGLHPPIVPIGTRDTITQTRTHGFGIVAICGLQR